MTANTAPANAPDLLAATVLRPAADNAVPHLMAATATTLAGKSYIRPLASGNILNHVLQ